MAEPLHTQAPRTIDEPLSDADAGSICIEQEGAPPPDRARAGPRRPNEVPRKPDRADARRAAI